MILLYAVLGLLVGAVLNVLADTMPLKAPLRAPRCAHCEAQRQPVAWLETAASTIRRNWRAVRTAP